MIISIITLFPEVFTPTLNSSILKAAQKKELVKFQLINLRDFGEGVHKSVDGRVYGGGVGMLLRADVLTKALKKTLASSSGRVKTVLTTPSGKVYKQKTAKSLSKLDQLIIICGHYEGVDQRFIDQYVDMEVSIGDFVLTGGEIPAMAIVDSITRLIPGVLKPEATANESFSQTLLEHPHYTRPEKFQGRVVPSILLSGNHALIDKWRNDKALQKTKKIRPDLIQKD